VGLSAPSTVIVSIGAVTFTDEIEDRLYQSVSLPSATQAGLSVEGRTLAWWLGQDDTAQQQLTGGEPLGRALADFNDFVRGAERVWANSPSFDLRILEAAMDAVGITPAWEYYEERDFRTLKNLPGTPDVERHNEHDALADAEYQAEVAARTLERYSEVVADA